MFTRYCFRNRQTDIFRVFTEKETGCGIVIVWCSADCILFPRWQGVEIQRCNRCPVLVQKQVVSPLFPVPVLTQVWWNAWFPYRLRVVLPVFLSRIVVFYSLYIL